MSDDFFDRLREPCPHDVGTRVEITGVMPNDPNPIPIGTRGTVTGGTGSQIWVKWDNGSRLALLVGEDPYEVVPHEEVDR